MFVLSFIYVLFSFVWQNPYFCPSSSYPIVFLSQLQEGSTCGVISSFNVLVGCPNIYVISIRLTFNVWLSFDCWLVSMEVYEGFWKWGAPKNHLKLLRVRGGINGERGPWCQQTTFDTCNTKSDNGSAANGLVWVCSRTCIRTTGTPIPGATCSWGCWFV